MIGGATTVHSGVVPSWQCPVLPCYALLGSERRGMALQCTDTFNQGVEWHGLASQGVAGQGTAMHGHFQSQRCSAMPSTALPGRVRPCSARLCLAMHGNFQSQTSMAPNGSAPHDSAGRGVAWQCTETFNMDRQGTALLCTALHCSARRGTET